MSQQPIQVLNQVFGYPNFRGDQEAVIQEIIAGNDALALMPTGSGKSLCYQIPGLIRPGLAVVVSPLIALMQNQVDALKQLGLKATYLNSTLSSQESWAVQQQVREGRVDFLYVAPERLLMDSCLEMLKNSKVALFAIDEAHCVSQWGHDFRPEYLKLSLLSELFPDVPRIALTATADETTRKEIINKLSLEQSKVFISSFDRPNIKYTIVPKDNARQQLLNFLKAEHQDHAGIVYCLSRKKTEQTAEWLVKKGYKALPYHAGLSADVRRRNQDQFLAEDDLIVVATIAFGMGIDKPNVRFVAHLDLPKSIEAYYQETGRAGRDGDPADAWMAYGLGDVVMLRQMMDKSEANAEFKRVERQRLNAMLGLCETSGCRRQILLRYFDEELKKPCGNCDTCVDEIKSWDGTVAAQKALSCVYRTNQRFGAGYLVDVLLGKANDRIQRFNHDKVSTFGIGQEHSSKEWHSIFRQLIAMGILSVDTEGYGTMKLNAESKAVLKGEREILFRVDPKVTGVKDKPKKVKNNEPLVSVYQDESQTKELFDHLRVLRRQLSLKQDIPPYMIFHDKALKEMVSALPEDERQMLRVGGVGQAKLDRYGQEFIGAIKDHIIKHDIAKM